MVKRDDLTFVSTNSYFEGHQRDVVSYNEKTYIVGHHKVVGHPETDPEAFAEFLARLNGADAMLFMFGMVPLEESFVMEAKYDELEGEWVPANECGPQCETGVCNKRIASNTTVGSQELAYGMLVDHLNA